MREYDHKKIEKKWQKKWKEEGIYKTDDTLDKPASSADRPKEYVLDMFPYPSGEGLHVGHPKGYIATDIYSRYKKMSGFNVLHPMGWDAFGLPAENYALKNKVHPRIAVEKNIARYKEQLSIIGFNYDWDREINTTDPEYYKWTQWIFLQLFKHGLAYESHEPINWCPSCKTGLANEDLENGLCERCGSAVEKKRIRQWMLRITDYAERLLNDLDELAGWPEHIKELQRNWIGKSDGAEIEFGIKNSELRIKIFTTRPDTLFGATYVVLAPEHNFVKWLLDEKNQELRIKNHEEVKKYIHEASHRTEIERTAEGKEKTGVLLKGVKAINPANKEEIPIFIADYVLADYGTGAIMAVPAHDKRDWEFAEKYALSIKQVIIPTKEKYTGSWALIETSRKTFLFQKRDRNASFAPNKIALFGGGIEDGEDAVACLRRELREELSLELDDNQIKLVCVFSVSKHSRPALFYISNVSQDELVFGDEGEGIVEMTLEEALEHSDVADAAKKAIYYFQNKFEKLPDMRAYTEDGVMANSEQFDGMKNVDAKQKITEFVGGRMTTTYKLRDWVFSRQRYWGEPIPLIHCEKCGVVPVPEKDLPVKLPEVENYEPTGTGESPLVNISEWVNVSCPTCGGNGKRETNTMPSWAGSSWYYLRYIDSKNHNAFVDEKKERHWSPVDMYVGGAEHATRHLIYARFWHKFLYDRGYVSQNEPFARLKSPGLIFGADGRKMSKRFGNVVNPDDVVRAYGADTFRLYEMFMGPFGDGVAWSDESIIGQRRFLMRVWRLYNRIKNEELRIKNNKIDSLLHQTIKKVTEDIEQFKFNTAISALMILVHEMEKEETLSRDAYCALLIILAPFAPHITEELWREILQNESSIHLAKWPHYDESKIVDISHTLTVQINGKVRDTFISNRELSEDEARVFSLAREKIKKWTDGKEIKKIIYVKDKLINFVIASSD